MELIVKQLAKELNLNEKNVRNTIELINEGNTIPFIARYRKEVTGNMSDEVLRNFEERFTYLTNLENRKDEVKKLIDKQGLLTDELIKDIDKCLLLKEVEDIYLPFKPKKRTKATIAKEKGLDPLADYILSGKYTDEEIENYAKTFVNEENEIVSVKDAIEGAGYILAEKFSENVQFRNFIRKVTNDKGFIVTKAEKGKEEERSEFENYYNFEESIRTIQNHRVLAINRGEAKNMIKCTVRFPEEDIIYYMNKKVEGDIKNSYIKPIVEDSYKRLISKSIEREIRNELTERADENAIKVFGKNLNSLLLVPPVKNKVIMGFDPAYRTGCKIAVINGNGKLLATTTVYPTKPDEKIEESKKVLKELIEKYNVDIISIGNGTASRESETFVADMLKEIDRKVEYVVVSEAGASVYSASKLGNEEYPELNVSLRGAVSIAQRLKDPLAELVKIDPKHIGVGQYQHDVNQSRLSESLNHVVEDAVNSVGVDVNSASPALLSYVSGISKKVALNIFEEVKGKGGLKNRDDLKKVSGVGSKCFEQCAGFLRVPGSDNILDNTGVHPESYGAVEMLFEQNGKKLSALNKDELAEEVEKIEKGNLEEVAEKIGVGVLTIKDILNELKKPGRDPRDEIEKVSFKSEVMNLEDLSIGMVLKGTVRNITNFGAFVDIGIHDDALVHISQLSDKFVKDPFDVVHVSQIVKVKVLDVDLQRKRVSLTMKGI